MDTEDIIDSQVPCGTCGYGKIILRDGYFYCMECGTRAADSQKIDFSVDIVEGPSTRRKLTKKVSDTDKYSSAWTSWHAYNMILVGLTEELASFCTKQNEFKKCVLKLWGMYLKLNQIAFFTTKRPKYPNLCYGMHARDLEQLYNIKKPKRKKGGMDLDNENITNEQKKRLLIKRHFKNAASSQLSSATAPASQTLADLSQTNDDRPTKLRFSNKTKKILKKHLSQSSIEHHKTVGFCQLGCRCLLKRKRLMEVKDRPHYISMVSLYSILALGLRICDEEVHLGDILRWCREEHLSFATYDHFFPDDMKFKKDDPKFKILPREMSHSKLRKTAGLLAKSFKLNGIKAPDFGSLILRYIKELELPHDLYYYIIRLVKLAGGLSNYFPEKESILPNYEAKAMAYIIIMMKMIFGLDGTTENNISSSSERINSLLKLERKKKQLDTKDFNIVLDEKPYDVNYIFVLKAWMKYIEYRKVCLKYCHYPTKMKLNKDECDDPELFLHHKNATKKNYENEYTVNNEGYVVIKSILSDIVNDYNAVEESYPIFLCSLNPMLSYTEYLIPWMELNSKFNFNRDILEEEFKSYNVSFFFNPKSFIKSLSDIGIKIDIFNNRHGFTPIDSSRSLKGRKKPATAMETDKDVVVIDVEHSKWLEEIRSDKISDILNNIAFKDQISVQTLITLNPNKTDESNDTEKVTFNIGHSNYWIRHYEYIDTKFNNKSFEEELDKKFPVSFSWLLRECASVTEMETLDLFKEICTIENVLKMTKKS